MAVRQLRFNNDEALRKKSREVKEVNEKIRILLDDMMDSLHASKNGAALAANQVGILRRLVVIDYEGYYLKLVNPVIIESDREQEVRQNGAEPCNDRNGFKCDADWRL